MGSLFNRTHLGFDLSNYRSFISVGDESYFKVVYDVSPDRWGELKLKNGSDLLRMPGTVHFRAHDGELDKRNDSAIIGTLNYIASHEGSSDGVVRPSPDHFSIECLVPSNTLNHIYDAELAGLGPVNLWVTISDGLKYGWAPDGSNKTWESEDDWVPVEAISFTFKRPELDQMAENDDSSRSESTEPAGTPSPINEAINQLTQKLNKSLLVVMALLAFIAATLAFK